jgi:thiamine biosynthesis protein ThiS
MKKINKVKIKINGKNRLIKEKMTLKSLLNINKVALNNVAIELNKKIIDKKKINKIKLKNGDKIEIVHFIGGG